MKKKIKLKKGSISSLQKYVAEKIKERGFEDESLHERLLLLAEEVGELIHDARKLSGMYCDKNRSLDANPGEEVADIINLVFAVAIKMGLDMEKEFLAKESKNDKRSYHRVPNKL